MQKCGQPLTTEPVCVDRPRTVWAAPAYPGGAPQAFVIQQCEPMEDWVYHRGPGTFLGIVRFHNGAVESVRDGERVR